MSTLLEIEQAIEKLPAHDRSELEHWMQSKSTPVVEPASPRCDSIRTSVVFQPGWNPGGRKLSAAEVQGLFDELRG